MLKRTKTGLIVHGLLMIAIAVFCFATPQGTMLTFAWILGLLFILGGIITFFLGRSRAVEGIDTMHLISAILMVAVGIIIIVKPSIIAVLVGLVILVEGIDFIVRAVRYHQAGVRHWALILIVGILVTLLGLWAVLSTWVGQTLLSIIVGVGCLGVAANCFAALSGIKRVEAFFQPLRDQIEQRQQ